MIKLITIIMMFATSSYAADITVDMLNKRDDGGKMVYSEDISRIDTGEMITWLPTDKGHNVEFIAGPEGFEIPKKSKLNKEYSMIFNVPGVYLYQCTPHKGLGMIALVVVGGDTSNKDDIANAKTFGKSKKILPNLINQL